MSNAPHLRTMYMPDADCWDWAKGYDWEPLPDAQAAPRSPEARRMAKRPKQHTNRAISKKQATSSAGQNAPDPSATSVTGAGARETSAVTV
jgi:hypothetical protein